VTLTGFASRKQATSSSKAATASSSERNTWSCPIDGSSRSDFRVVTMPDGSRAGVYLVRSLRVGAGTRLDVRGALPVVIVALRTSRCSGRSP
jgi:hypothetical protein